VKAPPEERPKVRGGLAGNLEGTVLIRLGGNLGETRDEGAAKERVSSN